SNSADPYTAYLRWNHGRLPSASTRSDTSVANGRCLRAKAIRIVMAVASSANASGNTRKLFDSTGGDNQAMITTADASGGVVPRSMSAVRVRAAALATSAMIASETIE